MTDQDLFDLLDMAGERDDGSALKPVPVIVTGGDYTYRGWIVGAAVKRSGAIRSVVEDDNGRLFIHNAKQLTVPA